MVDRVIATPAALALIATLQAQHGRELMFHQSGGCCGNSPANSYLAREPSSRAHSEPSRVRRLSRTSTQALTNWPTA